MSGFFTGGPADKKYLVFGRQPVYLRVVATEDGQVDVLDQFDDYPEDWETVHVYRSQGPPMHVCSTDRKESGWAFTYEHMPEVDGEQLRDTDAWREWAQAQPPRSDHAA